MPTAWRLLDRIDAADLVCWAKLICFAHLPSPACCGPHPEMHRGSHAESQ
jgi:hypothetical protein